MQITPSKVVKLGFKIRYSDMLTSINLLQGLNSDITIHAKLSGRKAVNLGLFTIGGLNFDKDGNATVQFKSLVDSVNLNNINDIISSDPEDILQLKFMAVLELPESEG